VEVQWKLEDDSAVTMVDTMYISSIVDTGPKQVQVRGMIVNRKDWKLAVAIRYVEAMESVTKKNVELSVGLNIIQ
jgi:hypothetical protein